MPQISRSQRLLKKAEAALFAAIEIYNKPDFQYREETFAILVINSWELLVKAKLLAENRNDLRCLYAYEVRKTKTGKTALKKYLRRNRTGNVNTISFGETLKKLETGSAIRLPAPITGNLEALTVIRDNAVHFLNPSSTLAKHVLEIGTASVRNFVELASNWFKLDLSKYSLYLLPIGFIPAPGVATALPSSADERNLINYLSELIGSTEEDPSGVFQVSFEVHLILKRVVTGALATVAITTDPAAQKVILTEEDVRTKYPWDYRELTKRLKERYANFKENESYHQIRRPLLEDERLVNTRYLDPGNPKSVKKDFYNPNVLQEFDKHYQRKT
jgi:hypothetical protein